MPRLGSRDAFSTGRLSHQKNLVFEQCYKHRRERRHTREPLGKVAEPRN
jgi:hypothetical protein